jgi:hypothetical protein
VEVEVLEAELLHRRVPLKTVVIRHQLVEEVVKGVMEEKAAEVQQALVAQIQALMVVQAALVLLLIFLAYLWYTEQEVLAQILVRKTEAQTEQIIRVMVVWRVERPLVHLWAEAKAAQGLLF